MLRLTRFSLPLALVMLGGSALSFATCTNTTSGTVKICTPTQSSHHTSPVEVNAGAAPSSGTTINNLQAWIDGVKRAQTYGSQMDVFLSLAPGWHNLNEYAFENNGAKLKASSSFSVFNNEFAYTVNTLDSTASGYKATFSLSASPALVPTPGSPYVADEGSYQTPALGGKYLMVNSGAGPEPGIMRFSVNGATGQLTLLGTITNGFGRGFVTDGEQLISSPSGAWIYVGGQITGSNGYHPAIAALHVNSDGSLTQLASSPYTYNVSGIPAFPDAMGIAPSGKFLFMFSPYTTNGTDGVQVPHLLSIPRNSDGSLSTSANIIETVECTSINTPSLAVSPDGRFVFVNCQGINDRNFAGIQVYHVNTTTGQLSYMNNFQTHPVRAIAIDRTGRYLFAIEDTVDMLQMFSINSSTGALTLRGSYTTGHFPSSVAVDWNNGFVYVTNGGNCYPKQIANGNCTETNPSNNIFVYQLNYSAGTLFLLGQAPIPSGQGTRSMVLIPR